MEGLQRGDAVVYKGRVLYYQPNGSSCHLYECPQEVGHPSKRVASPAKTSVRKATPEEQLSNDTSHTPSKTAAPLTPLSAPSSSSGRPIAPRTFSAQPKSLFQEAPSPLPSPRIRLLHSQPLGTVSVHQVLRFLMDSEERPLLSSKYVGKVKKVARSALINTGWEDKRVCNEVGEYAYAMFTKNYSPGTEMMTIASHILQSYQKELCSYKPKEGRPDPSQWQNLVFELHLTISANHETTSFAFEVPVFFAE